jgi:hypothetical protein
MMPIMAHLMAQKSRTDFASTSQQAWKHIQFETKHIEFCRTRIKPGFRAQTLFDAVGGNLHDQLNTLYY